MTGMDTTESTSPATSPATSPVVNLAAYKFVKLTDLPERRQRLREICIGQQLKGTILLSSEGINLFVAGCRAGIDALTAALGADAEIGPLDMKESHNDYPPFNRMLVKIKKEIIAFGVEGIDPSSETSQRITPAELKSWLDEGRQVTLLDVRNDYEVSLGTFEGAVPIGVDHFRDFPTAADRFAAERQQETVVMFCTGGIRCEKAGPYLQRAGVDDVYQLDGGILKYFEDCGQQHFRGECFVFDKRTALDGQLSETATTLCFACQCTLNAEEQASPQYVVGQSCPHCYED
jgi:UPF0176 protein